jgi:hypothetical protein
VRKKRYRLLTATEGWPPSLPFALYVEGREVKVGEEFEFEFNKPEHEAEHLESGLLAVVDGGKEEAA